jgi:oligopeptide transport system substrate-binding protein
LITEDDNEAYELWKSNQIDYAPIPEEELTNHLDQYPDQITRVAVEAVYYLDFNFEKPPFDNVHLRRAFSAAFNRTNYVNEILQDGGIPMVHLAPPGVFGAPPADEIGVGYDLEFARSELALAGFPHCQGLPNIDFINISQRIDKHADDMVRLWEEGLECPEGTFNYQRIWDYSELDEWDLFATGWQSDYPDEDNWVGTILSCEYPTIGNTQRSCDEVDELIVQAREEISASDRIELYRQIEEAFFGEDGTFPLAPIFSPYNYIASADWLENDDWFQEDYSKILIDMDAKETAQGE